MVKDASHPKNGQIAGCNHFQPYGINGEIDKCEYGMVSVADEFQGLGLFKKHQQFTAMQAINRNIKTMQCRLWRPTDHLKQPHLQSKRNIRSVEGWGGKHIEVVPMLSVYPEYSDCVIRDCEIVLLEIDLCKNANFDQ